MVAPGPEVAITCNVGVPLLGKDKMCIRDRFVTNAGINTVIIYDVDKETGVLTPLFHCKTSGDYPKAVAVMPDNKHFIVLSHETDEIFTYNMNYEDRYFLQDSKPIKIEQPNCIFIHKLS